jgi:hypothetical protein
LLAPSAAAHNILKRKFITEDSKEFFASLKEGGSSLSETWGTFHRFDTGRCPEN